MKKSEFWRWIVAISCVVLVAGYVVKNARFRESDPAVPVLAGDSATIGFVVEGFGYGSPDSGQAVSEVHRAAVKDALINAVVQAEVGMNVQVRIDGMRLKERVVRSRSMGYVESSRVLDAGFMSTNNPSIYRVRMEVSVRPLPAHPATILSADADRWLPTVALTVQSEQGAIHAKSCREALSSSLRECGIRVVDLDDEPTALVVDVALTQSTNDATWKLQWKMGRAGVFGSAERPGASAVQGKFMVFDADLFPSLELDRLGVLMAQDALRLWVTRPPDLDSPPDEARELHQE
ncbi:MAG: hypothetical protein KAU94_09350 [Verrucomicrobia bacterium]|nr:hypothetical protein [Verrucomicrobiota bacterium]